MKKWLLLTTMLALSPLPAKAQEILFKPSGDQMLSEDKARMTQKVEFNTGLLVPGKEVRVTLPLDGKRIIANLIPVSPGTLSLPEGQAAWRGRIEGRDGGEIFVVAGKGFVRGNITFGGMLYELRIVDGVRQTLEQVDPGAAYPDDHPEGIDERVVPRLQSDRTPPVDRDCDDPEDEIDVMVVYTDDARAAAGGTAAMQAEIAFAVAQGNLANANSNVFHRFNLVHTSEVAYTEPSGGTNFSTALDQLRLTTDGVIDGIHALRDTHKADLVAMITETSSSGCGLGYVIDPAGATSDQFGFSVAKRSCIGGNLSLAHEMSHNMSARHDRGAYSPLPSSTTNYNWGHIQPVPTGTEPPWRTVMAYDSSCTSSPAGVNCARLAQFSNPNVSIGGDPTGLPTTNANPEFNVMALGDLDGPVSQFRCRASNATANVWMKDTWTDTGLEPDPATAGQPMWQSPYIWVRNDQDTALTNSHVHQNPELGQTNFVYVKAHNDGTIPATADMELYFADASTNLNNPANWNPIGTVASTSISPGTSIIEFPWSGLPGTGHYCLLARWNDTGSALAFTNVNDAVRNSNDLVWRNISIVDLDPDEDGDLEFVSILRGSRDAGNFLFIDRQVTGLEKLPWAEMATIQLVIKARETALANMDVKGAERIDGNTFAIRLDGGPALFGPIDLKPGEDINLITSVKVNDDVVRKVMKQVPNGAVYNMALTQLTREGAEVALNDPSQLFEKDGLVTGGVSYMLTLPAREVKQAKR